MDILDTIKGKTILSFEVINTICSRTPSVCISELFPDNARLIEAGGAYCLVRKALTEQCGCGLYCTLNVTHSSWYIKARILCPDWVTVGSVALDFVAKWKGPQTVGCATLSPRSHCCLVLANESHRKVDISLQHF